MRRKLPQWIIDGQLEQYREQFEAGNNSVIIAAIRYCGRHQVVQPKWLVDAFHRGTTKWTTLEVKTLDAALGLTLPKYTHFEKLQKRNRLRYPIYDRVKEIYKPGINSLLEIFLTVAAEFGVNRDYVSNCYYEVKRLEEPFGGRADLLQKFCLKLSE